VLLLIRNPYSSHHRNDDFDIDQFLGLTGEVLVEGKPARGGGLLLLLDPPVPCRELMGSASRSGAARGPRPAVLLSTRGTQTGEAVRLERTLPEEELLFRQLVAAQGLFHRDRATAHGNHHRGFAPDGPPRGIGGWQIVHLGCSRRGLLDDAIQRVLQDLGRSQNNRSLTVNFVGEIRCLPSHDFCTRLLWPHGCLDAKSRSYRSKRHQSFLCGIVHGMQKILNKIISLIERNM
jgi:hypothetical protein